MGFNVNIKLSKVPKPKVGLERAAAIAIWSIFFVILACDIIAVNRSLSLIYNGGSQQALEFPKRPQGVKIDFEAYKKAVERIEQAESFRPQADSGQNPFRSPVRAETP